MDIEQAVVKLLTQDAGVAAIVGTRIFPGGIIPQGVTYPAMAYGMVNFTPILELTAVNPALSKRIRIWSATEGMETYGDAKQLDAAVQACLSGYKGLVSNGQSPASSLDIQGILPISSYDLFERETETHMVISDFAVIA